MRQCGQLGVVGLAAMFIVAMGGSALASGAPAPEISPSSISTGLALLAGSVLLVRSRRGRK